MKRSREIRWNKNGEWRFYCYLTFHTGGYWSTIENQKQFFEKFAQERGLDPLNPNDWHNVTVRDILNIKVFFLQLHFVYYLLLYNYVSAPIFIFAAHDQLTGRKWHVDPVQWITYKSAIGHIPRHWIEWIKVQSTPK